MSAYRVTVFKNLLNSNGHQFRCLQKQFDRVDADSPDQAADCAARQIEKLYGLRSWKAIMDSMEVELTTADH